MTERQREFDRERRWELYRRSVVERMPDSDYKTAVLAGIAHELHRLDRIETIQSTLIEKAGTHGMNRNRGLAKTSRIGRNVSW